MRKYNIPPAFSGSLQLGRQGENGVTEITFLCAGYAKMYGDGFAEAVHRTPDGTTYPVNIEQDENNRVSWLISDGDTATAGTGQLELRWMVNGNLAKSKIFSTIIKSALTAPETPPDAAKSWVDKVLKAAEDIKEGAIDDEKLAKAIAEYLEKHPIESGITEQNAREIAQSVVDAYQEKDPTVPDWAKAETKPTYTAAEVGAVPESAKSDIDKNTSARHTHSNKSALDSISERDIAKWNSGTAGTVEITGATGLAAGSAPTVTEAADSTAQARKYQLGIPAGKDGADGAKGDKGETGAKGDKGEQGADGKSAYQFAQEAGYTGTETEFGAKLNQTTFANPFPLTFTGAASATYDGSSAVTVDLPSGGSLNSGKWEVIHEFKMSEITPNEGDTVMKLSADCDVNSDKYSTIILCLQANSKDLGDFHKLNVYTKQVGTNCYRRHALFTGSDVKVSAWKTTYQVCELVNTTDGQPLLFKTSGLNTEGVCQKYWTEKNLFVDGGVEIISQSGLKNDVGVITLYGKRCG